jgi:hypothetical protein
VVIQEFYCWCYRDLDGVSFFGQTQPIFYSILGIIGAVYSFEKRKSVNLSAVRVTDYKNSLQISKDFSGK